MKESLDIRNKSVKHGILRAFIFASIAIHILIFLALGAYKIVELLEPREPFIAPEIELVPQIEPEYVVNIKAKETSNSPLQPVPLNKGVIPSLNVESNFNDLSAQEPDEQF